MTYPGNHSLKNASLNPVSEMLGMGDQLQTQVQNQLDDERKKRLQASGGLNPNSPAIGSAIASLLGTQGGM